MPIPANPDFIVRATDALLLLEQAIGLYSNLNERRQRLIANTIDNSRLLRADLRTLRDMIAGDKPTNDRPTADRRAATGPRRKALLRGHERCCAHIGDRRKSERRVGIWGTPDCVRRCERRRQGPKDRRGAGVTYKHHDRRQGGAA